MIEKITKDKLYLNDLENTFSDVFKKEEVISKINNNSFTNYYAYIIDEEVVAFINYDIMYERSELININVKEEYQNQKIATKLLEFMINDCINKKVESITLEVRENNFNAIHLYEKMGFVKVSIRKGYYNGIDGLLMEKKLIK